MWRKIWKYCILLVGRNTTIIPNILSLFSSVQFTQNLGYDKICIKPKFEIFDFFFCILCDLCAYFGNKTLPRPFFSIFLCYSFFFTPLGKISSNRLSNDWHSYEGRTPTVNYKIPRILWGQIFIIKNPI